MIEVVWFKRDLRTVDHRPLAEAARRGPVLPLYIAEPAYWQLPDTSERQWQAVAEGLIELSGRLSELGAPLIVRVGEAVGVLERIHAAVGIARLWAHEETGNDWTFRRDRAVAAFCAGAGIEFREFNQTGAERGRCVERDGWAQRHRAFLAAQVVPEPERLVPVSRARVQPIPRAQDLGLAGDAVQAPTGAARRLAMVRLESFLSGRGTGYRKGMSSPERGASVCSRLSVALAVGSVSAREVVRRLEAARAEGEDLPPHARSVPLQEIDSLTRRLYWRGHFIQKFETEPSIETRAFHAAHEAARVSTAVNDGRLRAWAEGQTGFPFLDACMRSLGATGWLNFRMRAMLQSFASYHLGIDWQASGRHLARLFTDYEPGIHWSQVQMQAGQTGINVPRIYNPVKQGIEQDPLGTFTRRWVPELGDVPDECLQTPWQLERTCVGYPQRIVDHAEAARAAKARLTAIRAAHGYRETSLKVFMRHGSRLRRPGPVESGGAPVDDAQARRDPAAQLPLL